MTEGLARTARVITAAAAIMVAVFGAFALSDEVFLKLIGVGLATAILVDATIVRLVLVPAVMQLLGDRNWWLPRWLDRVIPDGALEPARSSVLTRSTTTGASALALPDDRRRRAPSRGPGARRAERAGLQRLGLGRAAARRAGRRAGARPGGRRPRAAPPAPPAARPRRRRTPPAAPPRRALAAASSAVIPRAAAGRSPAPARPTGAAAGSRENSPQQPVRDVLDHPAAPERGEPAGDREVRLRVHARAAGVRRAAC